MNVLNLLQPTVSMQSATSGAQASQGDLQQVNGQGHFKEQLTFYFNQNQTATEVENVPSSPISAINLSEINTEELSLEQLVALIDSLFEQLEQLKDVELTEDQLQLMNDMNLQLTALLQLLFVHNNMSAIQGDSLTFLQTSETEPSSTNTFNQQLLTKLQDQLLQLQQSVQEGSLKVVDGKQPEQILSAQLQQFQQVLQSTIKEVRSKLIEQIQLADDNMFVVSNAKSAELSLVQLQRLAKESEFLMLNQSVGSDGIEQSLMADQASNGEELLGNLSSFLRTDSGKDLLSLSRPQGTATSFTMASKFADTIQGLVMQKFDISNLNGVTEARLMLTPEHLGAVDVKLSMQNGILTAVFQTENAMAKDAIENQMATLRASLAAQGITVEKVEVTQAAFSAELNWQQQRQQQQQFQDSNRNTDNERESSFDEQLDLNTAIKELGFGRAVNETV